MRTQRDQWDLQAVIKLLPGCDCKRLQCVIEPCEDNYRRQILTYHKGAIPQTLALRIGGVAVVMQVSWHDTVLQRQAHLDDT